jgi:hypothetical protein
MAIAVVIWWAAILSRRSSPARDSICGRTMKSSSTPAFHVS